MGLESIMSPEEIRSMYLKKREGRNFSAIIMGLYGSGKTTLIGTSPRPLLIDSFDPKGTVVIEQLYWDEIESGNILIRPWWADDHVRPSAYKEWAHQWDNDVKTGFYNKLGTYAIDSMTFFVEALANQVSRNTFIKRGGDSKIEPGELEISDYKTIYNSLKMHVKISSDFQCHFLTTAHLVIDKHETTGEMIAELDLFKGLKSKLPALFTEKYVMDNSGSEHKLLTRNKKWFRASSQLGAGNKLLPEEEPNIRKILDKVGLPSGDKPSLFII